MSLFGRIKRDSVLFRAAVVALVVTSLSFAVTAYYHYNTYATTDYVWSKHTIPECSPMSEDKRNEMFLPGAEKYVSIYIDRVLADGPSLHIKKSYLQGKYPDIFPSYDISYSNQGDDQQAAIKDRRKQQSRDYHSELSSMKSDIDEYFESRYIEEALAFAFKWTILLPLSLSALLYLVIATKGFILRGQFRAH